MRACGKAGSPARTCVWVRERLVARAAIAVLAFGGNALIPHDQTGTHREQIRMARKAARSVIGLVREGFRVLVVHGNGPQVGRELLRNEETSTKIPPHPLDMCVASTQGTMARFPGGGRTTRWQAPPPPDSAATNRRFDAE